MADRMQPAYQPAPDIFTIPSHLPIPGAGLLPVNAFLIRGPEPVLVDTGMATDRRAFEETLFSLVDPEDLRWVVLTHDDRDHAGNLREVLMTAPRARVVANGLAVARLGEEWDLPPHRVRQVNPGRTLRLGGRALSILRPAAYDSPSTVAVYDHDTGSLLSADSFGAILPELVEDGRDLPQADYLAGVALFTRANAPWTALVDERKFSDVLDQIRRLAPRRILSSHAPGMADSTESLLRTMREVPAMDPWLSDEDLHGLAVESALARDEGSDPALRAPAGTSAR